MPTRHSPPPKGYTLVPVQLCAWHLQLPALRVAQPAGRCDARRVRVHHPDRSRGAQKHSTGSTANRSVRSRPATTIAAESHLISTASAHRFDRVAAVSEDRLPRVAHARNASGSDYANACTHRAITTGTSKAPSTSLPTNMSNIAVAFNRCGLLFLNSRQRPNERNTAVVPYMAIPSALPHSKYLALALGRKNTGGGHAFRRLRCSIAQCTTASRSALSDAERGDDSLTRNHPSVAAYSPRQFDAETDTAAASSAPSSIRIRSWLLLTPALRNIARSRSNPARSATIATRSLTPNRAPASCRVSRGLAPSKSCVADSSNGALAALRLRSLLVLVP